MKTYEELVAQSTAVLTPHLNAPGYAHGYKTRKSVRTEFSPLSAKEIECRERWKQNQIEHLKTMSSNAVLGCV